MEHKIPSLKESDIIWRITRFINSEDVLCRVGIEDKKLVLYDKFGCWDEGEYLGAMSEETKKRMRGATS